MKLLNIIEYQTENVPDFQMQIPLDTRPGLFFQLRSSGYKSAYFHAGNVNVPIIMSHGDNSRENVKVAVNDFTVTFTQGYQQAKTVYLYVLANNDWTDTAEFAKVYVDGFSITEVKDRNGNTFPVSKTFANGQIMLRCSPTNHPGDYATEIVTEDGKEYTTLIDFHEHYSDPDHSIIDYFYAWVNTVVECYKKD